MQLEYAAFAFIFTLAAVINGLGIVRWLSALAEYVRRRETLQVTNYGIFVAFAAFQFLLHVLLWWSLWGIRAVESFDFLDYLYLLTGPVLLFLASSLLVPDAAEGSVDLGELFASVRRPYANTLIAAWLWTLFLWPVFRGVIPPSMPYHAAFVVVAVALRFVSRPAGLGILAALNWILLIVFVSRFAMQLGGISGQL